MKRQHGRSRQGTTTSRRQSSARQKRRRQIRSAIRRDAAAAPQTTQTGSARSQVINTTGKLEVESALDAVRGLGISVDSAGNVDVAAARQVAEGAAISAARALGVEIQKADGSIDTAKARAAVSQVLGFSIERDGAIAQGEAAQRSQKAAEAAAASILKTANALGVNPTGLEASLRNADGTINTQKAVQIADIALNLKVAQQKTLGRQEALDALNASLDAATTAEPLSRRQASDTLEQLLSSSALVNGKIDRRAALKSLNEKRAGGT